MEEVLDTLHALHLAHPRFERLDELRPVDLAELLREYPGDAKVLAAIETSAGPVTLAFGPDHRVRPEPDFFAEVKSLLGESAIA